MTDPAHPLSDGLPVLSPSARATRLAAFHALLRGRAADLADLAASTGLSPAATRAAVGEMLAVGLGQVDGGRVTGAAGLSTAPTRHRLSLGGQALHTWCAYDAIGIPAALGQDAVVVTECGHCRATIEITISAGVPPAGTATVGWWPIGPCANAVEQFCPAANLFCHADHLTCWRRSTGVLDGRPATLADLAEQGRRDWASVRAG
ncbi:MAG: hypothetical protein JOZ47_19650 [Kutzneria sp.]|nr:hypothetical protein [Kutzneria sp.]